MEKTLYDTSALIEAHKKGEPTTGYTTILNLIEFPKALDLDLRILFPSRSDYTLSLNVSVELLKIGKPIPAIDTVIAAVALNRKLKVVTNDKHFLSVGEVRNDFQVVVKDL